MPEPDDHQLLADFVRNESEPAFAALVGRYVNLVYSTALRSTGNPHQAEEITQAVFIILARKAEKLSSRVVLSGWLYQTARLTSANLVKCEIRRRRREQEAYMQSTSDERVETTWKEFAPLLDDAMGGLGQTDRDAVVLRFFENKSAAEIGAALRMNEETARRRVNRALEKLRKFFAKRGVSSTTAIFANEISAHSVQAAPVALAKAVTAVALAKGATASASTLTLIKGALKIMAWTKMKTAAVVGAAILVAGTATIGINRYLSGIEPYFTHLDSGYLDKAPPLVVLRPSRYAGQGDYIITTQADVQNPGKIMRRDCSLAEVLSTAYGINAQKIVLPPDSPLGRYDLLVTVLDHPREALRQKIEKQLNLTAHLETIETNVLVLRIENPTASGLKVDATHNGVSIKEESGQLDIVNFAMSDLADTLGNDYLSQLVIDETGLTDLYDFNLHWDKRLNQKAQRMAFERALTDQLGLELVPTNMPVKMLVVEKTK